jgi:hypothetical protein
LKRYIHRFWIAAIAVASIATLAVSAAPAAAQVACPRGTSGPFCAHAKPIAVTSAATDVKFTEARLNGKVNGFGDITHYYFQYGKTDRYGRSTPTQTLEQCPPGTTNPAYCECPPGTKSKAYCETPRIVNVFALIKGLDQSTKYHFRIVAENKNGKTFGADMSFTTLDFNPIRVIRADGFVRHGRRFTVTVGLRSTANVTISLLFHGSVVSTFSEGSSSGTVRQRITAPSTPGKYVIKVVARAGGFTETLGLSITVF